jgi:hypothetical protein
MTDEYRCTRNRDAPDRLAKINTVLLRSSCGFTGSGRQYSSIEYGRWTWPGRAHGLPYRVSRSASAPRRGRHLGAGGVSPRRTWRSIAGLTVDNSSHHRV